jgi:hypothetical protein
MDTQKSIYDFVIVSIPPLILYFVGWAYLYFYLLLFGINLSEMKLDIQTVFIYSYSPFHSIVTENWITSTLVLFVIFFSIFIKWSLPRRIRAYAGSFFRPISSLSPLARIFALIVTFVVGIIILLTAILIPIAKWTAEEAANRSWAGNAPRMVILVSDKSKANQSPSSADWLSNFDKCQKRSELGTIFSDDDTFFLLCRSLDDPTHSGIVFEFRKETGLVSVRPVTKGGFDVII